MHKEPNPAAREQVAFCVGGERYSRHMADKEPSLPAEPNRRVFVVHGRNADARDSMFAYLRALGLQPLEWDQAVALTGKGTPYIGEVLDAAFANGQAIVVLMTPDDIAYLNSAFADGDNDPETAARGQARPNVLFEAGMAIGRDENHTILVELGDLRPFSDVGGRHTIRLDNSATKRHSLATRLETAGLPVDRSGTDWLKVGNFMPPGTDYPLGKRIPGQKYGPSIDGKWIARGGNKIDRIVFTNGPVDLFEVTVEIPEGLEGVQLWDNDTVIPRLPAFKTFSINGTSSANFWNSGGPQQFELIVKARLDEGALFEQAVWLDSAR